MQPVSWNGCRASVGIVSWAVGRRLNQTADEMQRRKRLPETIQMKRYRKTNERLIVCVRLNSDCSKRVEIRVDNQVSQVNQVNHPDARSRSAIYVNVRPRQQLDNVKSPKTWRIFRVAATERTGC